MARRINDTPNSAAPAMVPAATSLKSRLVPFAQRSGRCRRHGLDIEDGAKEVLDDVGLSLGAGLLDDLDLLLCILVGLGLGLCVALAVLHAIMRQS